MSSKDDDRSRRHHGEAGPPPGGFALPPDDALCLLDEEGHGGTKLTEPLTGVKGENAVPLHISGPTMSPFGEFGSDR